MSVRVSVPDGTGWGLGGGNGRGNNGGLTRLADGRSMADTAFNETNISDDRKSGSFDWDVCADSTE